MADPRCDKSDLPPSMCSHCRGGQQDRYAAARRERLLDQPGVVAAKFPGRCGACGEPTRLGEGIMRNPDGHGWLGECCMEDA